MTTGRRYTGPEAVAAGIVDAVAAEEELLATAVRRAATLDGTMYAALRRASEQR